MTVELSERVGIVLWEISSACVDTLMKPERLAECHQTLSSWVGSVHKTVPVHACRVKESLCVCVFGNNKTKEKV